MPTSSSITGFGAANTDFMDHAACRRTDTNLFIDETQANITLARTICAECPVTEACLTYALQLPTNTIGIYAGHTTRQLNKLRTGTDIIRHGTWQGYAKERRQGKPTCPLCRAANTRYHNERKKQRAKA